MNNYQLMHDIQNEGENEYEDLENSYSAEEIQRKLEVKAHMTAEKLIRKNRKELKRLKEHAGNCVLEGNYAGYSYAIKKLRKFYKQPYNDDLIKSMWNSTRGAVEDIIESQK